VQVKVIRQEHLWEKGTQFSLRLDGDVVGKIANGETKHINLNRQQSVLQVKQYRIKSNKLRISPGDCVKLTMKKWALWWPLCIGIAAIIGTVLIERLYADRVLESGSSWALFISAGIISWGVMLLPYLVFDSFDLHKV
jgi:translation initiation factor IF-1